MFSEQNTNMTDIIKVQTFSAPQNTVNAGTSAVFNFEVTAPSGYSTVGVIGYYTNSEFIFPIRITKNRMDVRNCGSSNQTITPTITVLFIKTDMI